MNIHPKYTKPEELKSALAQAADGDLDWVKELLEDGADPNGIPLIMAIQCNESRIVQLMIDAGADVNVHFAGTTPLIRAIQGCHIEVIEVLIKAGADINLKDENFQSPMDHANRRIRLTTSKVEQELMAKLLLDAGARE